MRRLILLVTTVAVVVAGSIIYSRVREDRWRPLPGGGEIRLVAVTYEKNPSVKVGGSMFEPLRPWLGPRWSRLLGPEPLVLPGSNAFPRLRVWFLVRRTGPLPRFNDYLLLSDHKSTRCEFVQVVRADSYGSGDRSQRQELIGVGFDTFQRAERRLHIRVMADDVALDFKAGNPGYFGAGSSSDD